MKKIFTMKPEYTNKVILRIYDKCKYFEKPNITNRIEYDGVVAWEIIDGGIEADEIEQDLDVIDDFHEYLILHFEHGTTTTFRNSYVDMTRKLR